MFIFKLPIILVEEIYYFVVDFPEHLKDWKEEIKWEINNFKLEREFKKANQ